MRKARKAITFNYRNLGSYRRSASRLFPPFADLTFRAVDVSQSLPKIARMSAASPKSQQGTSARYGASLLYLDCVRRSQSLSSGGMSRTFFAASARLFGCDHRLRFDCRMTVDHHACHRCRPFPDTAPDALNNGVFDVPISHHKPRFYGKPLTRR